MAHLKIMLKEGFDSDKRLYDSRAFDITLNGVPISGLAKLRLTFDITGAPTADIVLYPITIEVDATVLTYLQAIVER